MKIWFEFDCDVRNTWAFCTKNNAGEVSVFDTGVDLLRPFYFRSRAGIVSMVCGKVCQKFEVNGLPDTDEDVQVSPPGDVDHYKSPEHGTEQFATRYASNEDPNEVQVGGDHYKGVAFQPWDWARSHSGDVGLGYYEVSAISYIARFRKKGGIQDLEKVLHYVDKMLYCFKLGQYGNKSSPSLLRIREFNKQNVCDRFQSEAITLLCLWRNEAELLEVKKIVEELIQCQRDDAYLDQMAAERLEPYPVVVPTEEFMKATEHLVEAPAPPVAIPALGSVKGEGTGSVTPPAKPREPVPPPVLDIATMPLPPYKPLRPALKIPAGWNEDNDPDKLVNHE